MNLETGFTGFYIYKEVYHFPPALDDVPATTRARLGDGVSYVADQFLELITDLLTS